MEKIEFLNHNGTFAIHNPENYSCLYLPLAGESGLKSSITPNLGGDCKKDQNHFLLEPVSVENLHNNRATRNFWCRVEGKGYWSVCGNSAEQESQKFTDKQERSTLEAGFMWQRLKRISKKYELEARVTSFIPVNDNVEVMLVELRNIAEESKKIVPIASFPIYGRSADNLRDHRHVTSLLHRIRTVSNGVIVKPVLSFDERGHKRNETSYYVCGTNGDGSVPEIFYPEVNEFLGEGGSWLIPEAVRTEKSGMTEGYIAEGEEALGGIRFSEIELDSGQSAVYIVLAGIAESNESIADITKKYSRKEQVIQAFEVVKEHWVKKVNVSFMTGSNERDNYLKWICFQPILRRIFGCSFLPHHDYGKGGRGWRDLWQDCLALLIMEPSVVRQMIVDNYTGVRIDGTNATIIGSDQGEFIADRNNITRVWMDHAFWPFVTTKLYLDQTGDFEILLEKIPYFKDRQVMRGTEHDEAWKEEQGNCQKTIDGAIYCGSILEHILLENICAFYDVGEHNQLRLHGADWNDALDMAWERGESVAFTCAYAGNLKDIAKYLKKLQVLTGCTQLELLKELVGLLLSNSECYDDIEEKKKILLEYASKCKHAIEGTTIKVDIALIVKSLEEKAEWMMEHIRKQEWLSTVDGGGWFNGYYDNHGNKVECAEKEDVRMMLTGQVFSIMSGTAIESQIQKICKSADQYLYEQRIGGYRLNTDFHEEKFDLGRMFGFAYGEKENGAVFSHMTVMYANALYKRGFVREGYKVLKTLLDAAINFERSKIYPGLPEYFNNSGRGLYSYLTGAASWYMLTMITEVYGVKGNSGNLILEPKLMEDEFDTNGNAQIVLEFAGRKFSICYRNPQKKTYGQYRVCTVSFNGHKQCVENGYCLKREEIQKLDLEMLHELIVDLV